MNKKLLISLLILCCSSLIVTAQTNRYWVGTSIYRNSLTSSGDLADWSLINDNGTGSWAASATGSSILTVDNSAGGYANKIVNVTGASPRLLPLDENDGAAELQIVALSLGTQFSIQVDEYTTSNTFITSQEILAWQSNPGFFTIHLSDFSFDASATQIRFVISARNTTATQGTLELNYFNYFNTDNNWSNSANWSATSGGAGGAGAPGVTQTAIFDAFSATNAIIDQPATVANITLASTFKSGLINAGSNDFTVTGASQLTGGFMVGVNDHLFVHDVTVSGTQFVSTSGIITITGTLTYVSGNFKPANGTMIFVSAVPQSIPGINFYNVTFNGAGAKTATGNFSVSNNFVNNSPFNAAGNTVVFNGTGAQSISGSATTRFHNVSITNSNAAGVTLSAPIQLTGLMTFGTNTRLTTGGNLTLIATSPTVTASIGTLTTSNIITGNIKVQKYIYSSLRVYRYLTSPVSGVTVADWQSSIPITGTFSNPSTGTGIVSTSPSMFTYTENVAGVRANGYAAYPAAGLSSAAALTPGKGYSIYVRNNAGRPTVLEVNGTINRGTQNISSQVTYTSTAGGPSEDGWNLVGNPYPSSIDWSLVVSTDRQNIDNAIYYLDNNSASPVYRTWVGGVGTNVSNAVISSSQAFWVKANGGGTPLLRFREIHKTVATPSFYRIGNDLSLLRISLDSTASTFHDETVIRLTDEATADFDSEYDAYKLYDAGHPAIGSTTNTSPLLSVNALPQSYTDADTIALFVQAVKEGNYTLSVPEYTFDASVTAYLWDTYTQAKEQLKEGSTYAFTVTADSVSKTNRFKIVLNSNSLETGVFTSSSKNGVILFPNPVDQSRAVTIRCPQAKNQPAAIEVYDVTGTLLFSEKQVQGSNGEYSLVLPPSLTNGMYSIRIQTEGITSSSTFVVN